MNAIQIKKVIATADVIIKIEDWKVNELPKRIAKRAIELNGVYTCIYHGRKTAII